MELVVEMPGLEEIGDAVDRLVIDQDGTKKGLFRLKIVRRLAEDRGLRLKRANHCCSWSDTTPKERGG